MKKLSHMIPSALQGFFGKPAPQAPELEPLEMPLLRRRAPRDALLRISCPDPTAEEMQRDRHQYRAQWLVRQERWDEMATLLHDADMRREMTPGAMPVAERVRLIQPVFQNPNASLNPVKRIQSLIGQPVDEVSAGRAGEIAGARQFAALVNPRLRLKI